MDNIHLEEVSIEITNACPSKCIHCSSTAGHKKENELSDDEWFRVIEEGKELGASVLSISGGDPLAHPNWKGIVQHGVNLNYHILFYTCGIQSVNEGNDCSYNMISIKDLEFLKEIGARVIYSLEGSRSASHDKMTGMIGSFGELISNIIPRTVKMKIPVELHFTPTIVNIMDIDNFLALAERLEVMKVSFLRFVPQGRGKSHINELMITPKQFLQLQKKLYSYEGIVKFRIGCPLSFGHLLGCVEERPKCHAGKDLLLIRPDGEIHCCAACKDTPLMKLGNIREDSLSEIWFNSENINMVRKFNKDNCAAGYCAGCPWKSICGGGCPSQRILHNIEQRNTESKPVLDQWNSMVRGVDPMCPRFNKLINDSDVISNRQLNLETSHIEQDDKGNIRREE